MNKNVEKLQEAEVQPKPKDDSGILYFEELRGAYRKKTDANGPCSRQIRFLGL